MLSAFMFALFLLMQFQSPSSIAGEGWEFVVRGRDLDRRPRWHETSDAPPLAARVAIRARSTLERMSCRDSEEWELAAVAYVRWQASTLLPLQQAPPPTPFVNQGACPFECCTYRDWIATADVDARGGWAVNATADTLGRIEFSVKKGETITAMTGVVITTKLGQIKVLAPATAYGGSWHYPWSSEEVVELSRDDVVYLMTPHGESAYTAWLKGRLFDTLRTEDLLASGKAQLVENPRIAWWVKIRNAKGQIGWTDRPEDFENNNACVRPDVAPNARATHEPQQVRW